MTVRVVVADDHTDVRAALVQILSADERLTVVAEVDNGTDAVTAIVSEHADAVTLDVRMAGGGLAAVEAIAATGLPVTIVIVTGESQPALVTTLFAAGAHGFLTKGMVGADLPGLVLRCCAGERVLVVPPARSGGS